MKRSHDQKIKSPNRDPALKASLLNRTPKTPRVYRHLGWGWWGTRRCGMVFNHPARPAVCNNLTSAGDDDNNPDHLYCRPGFGVPKGLLYRIQAIKVPRLRINSGEILITRIPLLGTDISLRWSGGTHNLLGLWIKDIHYPIPARMKRVWNF